MATAPLNCSTNESCSPSSAESPCEKAFPTTLIFSVSHAATALQPFLGARDVLGLADLSIPLLPLLRAQEVHPSLAKLITIGGYLLKESIFSPQCGRLSLHSSDMLQFVQRRR
jgi:hypothetical protein